MDRPQLAKSIFDISHITGEFLLRSGQTSNEYFDKYRFESAPELLKQIAKALVPMIPADTEVLAGLEMGGIPICTALSLETGLPALFVRKEAKTYGTCQLAEGLEVNGRKLCIIEDVITTGGAVIDSTNALRERSATINHVLCVIYRGEGTPQGILDLDLKLSHLFTMAELKSSTN